MLKVGRGVRRNLQLFLNSCRAQRRQSAKLFLQSSELGLPQPLIRGRVCPSPLDPGGGAHSLARDGVGESQSRRGDINCGTIYICPLCCRAIVGGNFPYDLHKIMNKKKNIHLLYSSKTWEKISQRYETS